VHERANVQGWLCTAPYATVHVTNIVMADYLIRNARHDACLIPLYISLLVLALINFLLEGPSASLPRLHPRMAASHSSCP
jgi:hypothetical protein